MEIAVSAFHLVGIPNLIVQDICQSQVISQAEIKFIDTDACAETQSPIKTIQSALIAERIDFNAFGFLFPSQSDRHIRSRIQMHFHPVAQRNPKGRQNRKLQIVKIYGCRDILNVQLCSQRGKYSPG